MQGKTICGAARAIFMCGRTDIFCDIYSLYWYFTQKLNLVNDVKHRWEWEQGRGCASVIIKDIKNVKTSFFISFYMQIEIRRIIVHTCIEMHRHKSRPSRLYIMLGLWSVLPINTTEDLTQQTLVPRSRDPSPEVPATNAEAVTDLSLSIETIRTRSWRMRNGPCCQTLIELTLCCCNTLVFVSS